MRVELSREGTTLNKPSGIFQKRPRRLLFSTMTVLFGAILLAGNALAFPPGPTNNNDDPFNPTDFAPSCNPSPTLNLNNPTTAAAPVSGHLYGDVWPKGRHGQLDLGHRVG